MRALLACLRVFPLVAFAASTVACSSSATPNTGDAAVDVVSPSDDAAVDDVALDDAQKLDDVVTAPDVAADVPRDRAADVATPDDTPVSPDRPVIDDLPIDRPDVVTGVDVPLDRPEPMDVPAVVDAAIDRPDVVDAAIDRPDVVDAVIDRPDVVDVAIDRPDVVDAPDVAVDAGVCASPRALCGSPAACVDVRADAENCGRCGVRCPTGNACSAGACVTVGAVDGGEQHSCAILGDRTVMCWGHDEFGQIGDGVTGRLTVRPRPTPVAGLTDVTALSVGRNHACALRADGTVSCWGSNSSGQVGTGAYTDAEPIARRVAGISGAVAVTAGWSHSCAITAGGAVQCWGSNAIGQLGDGSTTGSSLVPVTVSGVTGATALAAGNFFTCAITTGGVVRCWGSNGNGQLGATTPTTTSRVPVTVTTNLMNPTAIFAGSTFACASSADGHLRCWGEGRSGQFGNGMLVATPTASTVSAAGLPQGVALGDNFACGLFDRSALCWGSNDAGQLANGLISTPGATTPTATIGLGGLQSFAAGANHACARMSDGRVLCWGSDTYGQLGNGAAGGYGEAQRVEGITGVAQVAARDHHTCLRMTDGTVRCTGRNDSGLLGDGSTYTARFVYGPVPGLTGVAELSAAAFHTCARLNDGTLRCWGYNSDGQCGDGTTTSRTSPVAVMSLTGVRQVSSGQVFSCALLAAGTVRCWGGNGGGTLGRGYTDLFSHPFPEAAVMGLTNATQIASALFHTCAVRADRTVMCWGGNDRGQLGDGTTTNHYVATVVPGLTDVAKISGGYQHTCAARGDGSVWCWGLNSSGQCGAPTSTANVLTPTRVGAISDAVDVITGDFFSCALRGDGSTWCWGDNNGWQLGSGTVYVSRPTAEAVRALPASTQVSAGAAHACALGTDGALRCWGSFAVGELGIGHVFPVRF